MTVDDAPGRAQHEAGRTQVERDRFAGHELVVERRVVDRDVDRVVRRGHAGYHRSRWTSTPTPPPTARSGTALPGSARSAGSTAPRPTS